MQKSLLITDMHIIKSELNGINTIESFSKVLASAQNNHYDSIILCGDLSQNGTITNYELICDLICQHYPDLPTYLIAGNHDNQTNLKYVTKKTANFHYMDNSYLDTSNHRLIFLNSNITDKTEGQYSQQTLAWLSNSIKLSKKPIYIFTHHHTLEINLSIDKYILNNRQEFLSLIKQFKTKIKMIICGHTHYFTDKKKYDIHFVTLPSASMQYSSTTKFIPDDIQMYAILDLYTSEINILKC